MEVAEYMTLRYPTAMEWSRVAPYFRFDGSLRDIYILDTSLRDWVCVWELLAAVPEQLAFKVDGKAATTPPSVEDALRLHASHSVTASYLVGKQQINCHFFCEAMIEFDLDPQDVDGPAEGERLAQFLAMLGYATSKEVRLTAENEPEAIIARYDPITGSVIWMPVPL